jgi:hypothetical protein
MDSIKPHLSLSITFPPLLCPYSYIQMISVFCWVGFELRAHTWSHSTSPVFCIGFFCRDRVLQTICPGWLWTTILLTGLQVWDTDAQLRWSFLWFLYQEHSSKTKEMNIFMNFQCELFKIHTRKKCCLELTGLEAKWISFIQQIFIDYLALSTLYALSICLG